jgi:hypothetical protein
MGILGTAFQRVRLDRLTAQRFPLHRSFASALLALVCIVPFHVIAQTPGAGEVQVTLSPAANPTASGVSLTGTVQPVAPSRPTALPRPGGTLTFIDGGAALNPGGTALTAGAAYTFATFEQTFGMSDAIQVNPLASWGDIAGDFNGDGTPDLLICSSNSIANTLLLQVFASIPGGKFVVLPKQSLSFPQQTNFVSGFSVLDVDGDGHLDLLIGNRVAYGKGDGTFPSIAVLPVLATGFSQTYAADVNGDGKLDIVAVDTPPTGSDNPNNPTTVQLMFTVFRNDGSGTFTSIGSFPLAAPIQSGVGLCCVFYNVFGLSFADINGDGKIDVLSQSNWVPEVNSGTLNHLNVMLNNGDGTFGQVKPLDTSPLILAIAGGGGEETAFGDLNGDGKLDVMLVYSDYSGTNYLASALGNGDGTFGSFVPLQLINFLTLGIANPQVQAIDLNADAKLDAVLGTGQIALGNGDGTFTLSPPLFAQPANPQTPLSYPLLQANLFPTSWPSLVYLNFTSGANAVFTPQDSSSANTTVALRAGTHTLTAHYSGDSTYAAGTSPAITIDVAPAATKTTITSSANPSYAGQSVTFTATIAELAPGAGGTVTFSNGSTALGTAAVSNGSASFATTFTSAGNQIITAAYGGDANDAASSGTLNQAVEAPVTVGGGSGGSTSLTVASGQSVATKVSVTGAAGFGGTVSFSCTGLPMNASCSFSPASVTVSGTTAGSTTMTVSTAAATMAATRDGESSRALTVLACGLPLLGLVTLLPVARGRRLLLGLGFVLFVSLASLAGCGGDSSSGTKTAPGSYSFNVVATSGSASSTASYKLTVQ